MTMRDSPQTSAMNYQSTLPKVREKHRFKILLGRPP